MLMLKISCAGCLGLSSGILSQFILEMCAAAKNCEKFIQNLFGGFKVVQSHRCWYILKACQQCLLW